MDTELAELFAVVVAIKPNNSDGHSVFTVRTLESKKIYTCVCPFFCPVREGDSIYAVVSECGNNSLIIFRPPFVQPSVTKENVIKSLITMAKMGYNQASRFYDKISEKQEDVITYISKLAEDWYRTKNPKLLLDFDESDTKKAGFFLNKWHKHRNLRRLYLLGLTGTEIKECEMTTEEIYKRCMSNPFTLYGIEIGKAMEIMFRNNRNPSNDDVTRGSILRRIYSNTKDRGWSGTPTSNILKNFPDYVIHKDVLHTEYGITAGHHTVFVKKNDEVEQYVAEQIYDMMSDNELLIKDPYFGDTIKLNEEQIKAVTMALSKGVSIITGGPGTGKTTILKTIVENLDLLGHRYFLCAFTGKAVVRMKEVTGRNAFTIHQLINKIKKWDIFEGAIHLKMIIIDEFSMVTTSLFYELLKEMKSYELPFPKVLFVGDIDQLPPIGWGDLAIELMKIWEIPRVILVKNMRVYQTLPGEVDGILPALSLMRERAEQFRNLDLRKTIKPIKELEIVTQKFEEIDESYDPFDDLDPDDLDKLTADTKFKRGGPFEESDNFFTFPGNKESIYDIIIDVHKKGLNQDDITIISPYNKDLKDLNDKFEQIFHEDKPFVIDHWKTKWHIGSRIICLENNYDIPIMNGEEATVVDFTDEELKIKLVKTEILNKVVIKTDKVIGIALKPKSLKRNPPIDPETGEPMEIEEFNTSKFAHAYALTVHRAQGSEWPFLIFYLPPDKGSSSFVNLNLSLTAVSRGKRAVWVIGNIGAFYDSLDKRPSYRHNTLALRLRELIDKK